MERNIGLTHKCIMKWDQCGFGGALMEIIANHWECFEKGFDSIELVKGTEELLWDLTELSNGDY